MTRSLVHLSDLHLGHSAANERALEKVVLAVAEARADLVVVTGDLTEGGRQHELDTFHALVEPIAERVVVVPGNHDRCGDDVGAGFMPGVRVDLVRRPGCSVIRIDTTAAHNRVFWLSHGRLCHEVLAAVERALELAPRGELVVVALHHHPIPLAVEGFWEHVSELLFLPIHTELRLGRDLLRVLRGRCDLVLHGHRHVPRQFVVDADGPRPMRVCNAGSTTGLGAFRRFLIADGRVRGEPEWVSPVPSPRPSPHVRAHPPLALQLG